MQVQFLTYKQGAAVMPRPARKKTQGGPTKAARKSTRGEKPTRKNYYLYQSKVDMAKRILGVETETDAVDAALSLVIYGEALALGTEHMGAEEYLDVLGISAEIPSDDDA